MKSKIIFKTALLCITVLVVTASSALVFADEQIKNTNINTGVSIRLYSYGNGLDYLFADASGNLIAAETPSKDSRIYDIDWHKILGWSTVGMAAVTLGSGAVISHNGHCQLAGVTTGLAAATCITGYYKYGSLISFTDGDWKFNTHAIIGTLATIGFITTIALAGEDGREAHVAVGATSGVVFALTIGVIYF
jgi:hypothetical protein